MLRDDSDSAARRTKVEGLCRQLVALIAVSREQRETINRILAELRSVAHRVDSRPAVRAAGSTRTFRGTATQHGLHGDAPYA
jgi:hypothetical protein